MFSEQLNKIDGITGRTLFFISAGLVIVCQLVAMGLVADEQVKKAELRASVIGLQRVAIAQCYENFTGPERKTCTSSIVAGDHNQLASSQMASNANGFNSPVSVPPVRGLMAVSFAR